MLYGTILARQQLIPKFHYRVSDRCTMLCCMHLCPLKQTIHPTKHLENSPWPTGQKYGFYLTSHSKGKWKILEFLQRFFNVWRIFLGAIILASFFFT